MRKLNMADYMVKLKVPDQMNPGQVIEGEYPYRVKDSILNLLFIQDLQLTGAELVKQNVLAMKLESCKEDEILLEDEEWGRIKRAVDTFKGFDRNAVELVTRINEAEVVEIK
jgi:hypothetical protein